ncbi:sigma-54 interaction domain-containing protein [Terrisporobacter glycolicus]|uniref:Anaerobic nitric oxide reductase transcription regulator NorR n=1 Tax=Terrisporobacter glycolicus ATCC 14880 = DSM 1288 TaxID=1121315 RepID=A0ABZ2EYU7_9FIRM|nr:sigma 54-interacting transcriptional regulator [Terrisporobacter glycolicus]
MKKIYIISMSEYTGFSIKQQLEIIFEKEFYIECLNLNNYKEKYLDCDLLIFSGEEVKDICDHILNDNINYIVSKRVIKHDYIDEILSIPRGTDVLLVNDAKSSCEEVIRQLKSQGLNHINYHQYYPGIKSYKNLEIAITPGEAHLVPDEVSNIIDIKSRHLDVSTLIEILIRLNCMDKYGSMVSSYFYRDMINVSTKYIKKSQESTRLKDLLTNLLDNQKNGIIYTNIKNKVVVLNEEALRLLGVKKNHVLSKDIYETFPSLKEDIININNKEILVSKEKIEDNNIYTGNMIILNEVKHIHKIDEEVRRREKIRENQAKYTFEDMVGNCSSIVKNIKLAKKVAKTNSTVLIQGETGTGKEVLAQAIHNESERCDYPFIAINFAAIPENLIESELFGYEDGAFTGARKGGKEGLFKKAHKGTIFLDEIGDASLYLQSRLLRVLQEREITPVGSTETIPIDIRVIAATNKELLHEVKLKNFREDLYYRLNVMPMYSIPLRERRTDIKLLLQYYLFKITNEENLEEFFTKEAIEILIKYNWPGNIRELVNVVEYVSTIKENKIKIDSTYLPKYIIENCDSSDLLAEIKEEELLNEKEKWVLEKIHKYEGIGRRTLSLLSKEEGIYLGEGKIRTIMTKLKNQEYIEINKGLKGTKILKKGLEIVEKG